MLEPVFQKLLENRHAVALQSSEFDNINRYVIPHLISFLAWL